MEEYKSNNNNANAAMGQPPANKKAANKLANRLLETKTYEELTKEENDYLLKILGIAGYQQLVLLPARQRIIDSIEDIYARKGIAKELAQEEIARRTTMEELTALLQEVSLLPNSALKAKGKAGPGKLSIVRKKPHPVFANLGIELPPGQRPGNNLEEVGKKPKNERKTRRSRKTRHSRKNKN